MDVIHEYKSLTELLQHVKTYPRDSDCSSQKTGDSEWSGTRTYEEAVSLAEYGWKDGYNKMKAKLSGVDKISQGYVSGLVHDVTGEFVDVERYLLGQPECMFTFAERTPAKFLRLNLNLCANSSTSGEEYYERGCVLMSLIDELEASNVRCEVWAIFQSSSGGNTYTVRTKVKDYSERLNREKLTFCICSPAMFRRIIFSEFESNPKELLETFSFTPGGGYGRATNDDKLTEGKYIGLFGDSFSDTIKTLKSSYIENIEV